MPGRSLPEIGARSVEPLPWNRSPDRPGHQGERPRQEPRRQSAAMNSLKSAIGDFHLHQPSHWIASRKTRLGEYRPGPTEGSRGRTDRNGGSDESPQGLSATNDLLPVGQTSQELQISSEA